MVAKERTIELEDLQSFDNVLNKLGVGKFQVKIFFLITICGNFFNAPTYLFGQFGFHEMEYTCESWKTPDILGNISSLPGNECYKTVGGDKIECDSWNYDSSVRSSSVVEKFDLVCDRKSLVKNDKSVYFAGFFTAAFLLTAFSICDKFGRRKLLVVFLALSTAAQLLFPLAPTFVLLEALRFVEGVGSLGTDTVTFCMLAECLAPGVRQYTLAHNMLYIVGVAAGGVLAYLVRGWVGWTVGLGAVNLAGLVLLVAFADESLRWYYATGRSEQFAKLLLKAAESNNTHVSPEAMRLLGDYRTGRAQILVPSAMEAKSTSLLDLLRRPKYLRRLLLLSVIWATCAISFYGLFLGATMLGVDVHAYIIIANLITFPARLLVFIVLPNIGRKPTYFIVLLGSAVCLYLVTFLNFDNYPPILKFMLAVAASCFVSCSFMTSWFYTGEVFPTTHRSTGISFCSCIGRLATIFGPQIARISDALEWNEFTTLVYAVLTTISCAIVLIFLPETSGKKMPDHINDSDLNMNTQIEQVRTDDC